MSALAPDRVVASFDSASVLHAANAAALQGRAFPHLGSSALTAAAVRAGGRLPWPLLSRLYARIGASEGVRPDQLDRVDLAGVAAQLARGYPPYRYPAVLLGSSNGALLHLAAAMQVPWLPGTVLVPVRRSGDPQRPVDALRFGQRYGPRLLDRNPDIALHHMHDQVQDELMVARMTYFRTKWRSLPDAYTAFLARALMPGAPLIVVEDTSRWPVTAVDGRHVFQVGAQGGMEPQTYLQRRHTPRADDSAPEAEWGADPAFGDAAARWAHAHGHPVVRIRYQGPQNPAHAVATVLRAWFGQRGGQHDTLLVPSFVLVDPWRAVNTGIVPFWTFFSVQPALAARDAHLSSSPRYRDVHVLPFQHGVDSQGIATPADWAAVIRRHGASPHFPGLSLRHHPHDIGLLGRYGSALRRLPGGIEPWSPLTVEAALRGREERGLQLAD